jgi:hypothetical protein
LPMTIQKMCHYNHKINSKYLNRTWQFAVVILIEYQNINTLFFSEEIQWRSSILRICIITKKLNVFYDQFDNAAVLKQVVATLFRVANYFFRVAKVHEYPIT